MTKIDKIFQVLKKNYSSKPIIELNYTNNFTLLIAVLLSAQTTDKGVNKATDKLFKLADTPQKFIKMGIEELKTHIKSIGLYNTKAKNVIALSKILKEKFNSKVPDNREDLVSLPGVGRKTANVVLSCAFGKPAIGVDTHVFRLSNRLGVAKSKNTLETEKILEKVIPDKYKRHLNHWMVLHGRYVCKSRKPMCKECELKELCAFYKKTV